jgi:hypothetical protein
VDLLTHWYRDGSCIPLHHEEAHSESKRIKQFNLSHHNYKRDAAEVQQHPFHFLSKPYPTNPLRFALLICLPQNRWGNVF